MAAAVQVVQSCTAAEKLLQPERLRIVGLLKDPDSATGLARRLDLPRQTVNYHLRELEKEGFVEFVEARRKRNCMERFFRAAARSYVISPLALGRLGIGPKDLQDRFSAAYLVLAASRVIRDVTLLRERAGKAGKRLASLTMETEVRFANAERRREFTEELLASVARLIRKYHDGHTEGGRTFRLLVGAYPSITKHEPPGETSIRME